MVFLRDYNLKHVTTALFSPVSPIAFKIPPNREKHQTKFGFMPSSVGRKSLKFGTNVKICYRRSGNRR